MKNIWNQLPLLRILIPFVCGIILAISLRIPFLFPVEVLFGGFVLVIIFIIIFKKLLPHYNSRWIFGLTLNTLMLIYGWQTIQYRLPANCKSDFLFYCSENDTIIATISKPVNERENSVKTVLKINSIKKDGEWVAVEGRSLAYFQKDDLSRNLKYGDELLINAGFAEISNMGNPGEFDYKRYMECRSVFTRGFVKEGHWKCVAHGQGNLLKQAALDIREYFLNIFSNNGVSGDEYAVASALILGSMDKVDADLIKVYQGTGALHVLSVSGMHVGVVFIVLNFLLAFLDRLKKVRYLKQILLVILIWFYAMITGLSPAVCRAAAMITFVIIGKSFDRNTSIYNTLAASALLLLVIDPMIISDIGFQLSYIAVIGIVLLYKPINDLLNPKKWIFCQIWSLVSVSLAAQIATFPLALYYFHQFPNYFLLTNLLVVPLSNLAIYAGMALLILSPFSIVSKFASVVLVFIMKLLNNSVATIESFPFSVTQGIYINTLETICIYLIIIFGGILFFLKNKKVLKPAIIILFVLLVSISFRSVYHSFQRKVIFYNVNKSTAVDFIDGNNHLFITDTVLVKDKKSISMSVENNWLLSGLRNPAVYLPCLAPKILYQDYSRDLYIHDQFVYYKGKTFAFINQSNSLIKSRHRIDINYLVISDNIRLSISTLLRSYKPSMIIIDSSNSEWKIDKWTKEAELLNVPVCNLKASGALTISI